MTAIRIGERPPERRRSLLLRRVTPGMALLVVAAIIVLRVWIVETAIVEGHSMEETLSPGDRVLVAKTMPIGRFDIVVLEDPETGSVAIKRVVGMPGDTVSMVPHVDSSRGRELLFGAQLYVNGQPYDEPYAAGIIPNSLAPRRVPDGGYFVLGDNRDASIDSRRYGPVDRDRVRGVGLAVVYPLSRMGKIQGASQPALSARAGGRP
jgi:signal peptidase I